MVEEDIELPAHAWVKRTLYLNGRDSEISNQALHFESLDDPEVQSLIIETLVEFGHELGIYKDFAPTHVCEGRWVIESDSGFSVIEIDAAFSEDQVRRMEEGAAIELDLKVWGGIFGRAKK